MKNPPCKGCERREIGCHGRCQEYGEWKKSLEKSQAARIQEAQDNDITIRGLERIQRGKFRRQK